MTALLFCASPDPLQRSQVISVNRIYCLKPQQYFLGGALTGLEPY